MKIKIISDLHLDHIDPIVQDYPNFDNVENCDILINLGDLCDGFNLNIWNWYKELSKQYKYSLYILGNHDYYNEDFLNLSFKLNTIISASNIKIFDGYDTEIEDINFIGCTLWSKINPHNQFYITKQIADYSYIRYNGRLITTDLINVIHNSQSKWLEKNINKNSVVLTHHLPSYSCINKYYRGSALNEAFANNLDNLILEKQPKYWLFGHTHYSYNDKIGDTNLICNPYGYDGQNKNFNKQLIIEV